jgi:hypothetical protein
VEEVAGEGEKTEMRWGRRERREMRCAGVDKAEFFFINLWVLNLN